MVAVFKLGSLCKYQQQVLAVLRILKCPHDMNASQQIVMRAVEILNPSRIILLSWECTHFIYMSAKSQHQLLKNSVYT